MGVLAVVLTYSCPDALLSCIRSIIGQTVPPDEILVIDNAGDPPASLSLESAGIADDRLRIVRSPTNGGPAGGHATGLEHFLASDHWCAWIMDDDCTPTPTCLEELLSEAGPVGADGVFVFPTWVHPSGEATTYPAWCGFLVSRDVVRAVGLPRRDLVWWGEDTEYLRWRIFDCGYRGRLVPSAVVDHSKARATGRHPSWKYYYEARNSVHLRLRRPHNRRKIPRTLVKLFARIIWKERNRPVKLLMLARGTVDGVLGRLGQRVPLSD